MTAFQKNSLPSPTSALKTLVLNLSVTKMDQAKVITLLCVLFCEQQRVFGTEMDTRVKAGDNITLYCDCAVPLGSHIVWLRNCSHEHQPSLLIDSLNMFQEVFLRFSFVQNQSSNSYDLHIVNISVSDEGIYYCAIDKRDVSYAGSQYQYGNRRTRLSVLESNPSHTERFNTTSTHPVSNFSFCWTSLFSVCTVCVLLFSVCVYCLCQRKTTVSAATQTENRYFQSEGEVCYASLNAMSMLKIKSSDFSTYTEVRTKRP